MTKVRPTSSAARRRLIALCGTGLFVIIAGSLLPKMLAPLSAPAGGEAQAAATAPGPGEFIPADLRPLVERVLIIGSGAVLLAAVVVYFTRRRSLKAADSTQPLLNITAALPLPHHCCAYLIRVGDRQFLAGVDAGGIRSLLPLPSPPEELADEGASPAIPESQPALVRVIA